MSGRLGSAIIEKYVRGLTFVDVGGVWGTTNEKVTVALAAGAKSATMMDIQPAHSQWWAKFHARAEEKGFKDRYTSIVANLDDVDLVDRYGTFEFVHCTGILYHVPNPFHTIQRLRELTTRYLLLGSATVPERVVTPVGEIDMSDGAAYFVPSLLGEKQAIFREHFKAQDMDIAHIVSPLARPWVDASGAPNYAPWWWLWSAPTVVAMAEAAGLKALEVFEYWPGKAHGILLERT